MEYYLTQDSVPLVFVNSRPENSIDEQLKALFGTRAPTREQAPSQRQQPQRPTFSPHHDYARSPYSTASGSAATPPHFLSSNPFALDHLRNAYINADLNKLQKQQAEIQRKKVLIDMQREFHRKQLELINSQESELESLYEQIEGRRKRLASTAAEAARKSYLEQIERQNRSRYIKEQSEHCKKLHQQRQKQQQLTQEKFAPRSQYYSQLQPHHKDEYGQEEDKEGKEETKLQVPIQNFFKALLNTQNEKQKIADKSSITHSAAQDFFDLFLNPELGKKARKECIIFPSEKSPPSIIYDANEAPQVDEVSSLGQDSKPIPSDNFSISLLSPEEETTKHENAAKFTPTPVATRVPDQVSASTHEFTPVTEAETATPKQEQGKKLPTPPEQQASTTIETVAPVEIVEGEELVDALPSFEIDSENSETPFQHTVYDTILNIVKQKLKEINAQEDLEQAASNQGDAPKETEEPLSHCPTTTATESQSKANEAQDPSKAQNQAKTEDMVVDSAAGADIDSNVDVVAEANTDADGDVRISESDKSEQPALKPLTNTSADRVVSESESESESDFDTEFENAKNLVKEKIADFKEHIDNPSSAAIKSQKKSKKSKKRSRKHHRKHHKENTTNYISENTNTKLNGSTNLPGTEQVEDSNVPEPKPKAFDESRNDHYSYSSEEDEELLAERKKNIAESVAKVSAIDMQVNKIIKTHEKRVFSNPLEFTVDNNGMFSLAFTRNNRAYREYAEELLKCLEALDHVNSYSSDEIRRPRKALVYKIQSVLDELDTYLESQETDYSTGVSSEQELQATVPV